MFRRLTTPQLVFDIALALACLAFRSTFGLDSAAIIAVVLLMTAALALRRLSPLLALGVAWVGAIVQMATLQPPDAANIAILAVLYATARHGDRRVRWLGLISAGVGAVVATLYLLFTPLSIVGLVMDLRVVVVGGFTFVASAAVLGLSWTAGLLARTWRAARDTRSAQLQAERDVMIEQERNRIARDMHDVVAHSLAVVIAQADGARYVQNAAAKDEALATISGTAREALADVRLLLGQLRHRQEAGPQPMLADLDRLIDQLRASGLTILDARAGSPPTLPAGQQLALYRIAQEALTNALRHGDAARPVELVVGWRADAVILTVTSALRATASESHQGHGLAGMRERALLVGGTLEAGPVGETWVVRADIPYPTGVHA
ncbi:histidine kinase [Leifsonia sp. H3M29-4]|uniref:sensor histidine kinase n=1 Tax=Salinibacterium metalliresistens TaxID=3031321 RepID=UPI0023DAC48D|nr:histidine kinase [Salinibacterium metalliresistens]MDF1478871.1 histidine kinase [Salinibacterium metalliresistens]